MKKGSSEIDPPNLFLRSYVSFGVIDYTTHEKEKSIFVRTVSEKKKSKFDLRQTIITKENV